MESPPTSPPPPKPEVQKEESKLLPQLRTEEGWKRFCEKVPQADHPIYPVLSRDNMIRRLANGVNTDASLLELLAKRAERIQFERLDPLSHGWEFPMWKEADELWAKGRELLILGGNRSSKSTYAAKRVMQTLLQAPNKSVWCFSTTHETSIRDQQRLIWQHVPIMWRYAKRGRVTNISYSQKTGFTMKSFVCPNGSECRFMNYQQDADVIEGGQVDLWWADELIPADWVITLRSRTIDRKGRGLITQTPIKGYTQTVAEYLQGARTVEWAKCDMLPNQQLWEGGPIGQVPYKMQAMNPLYHVMFFHSKNNPYVPYQDLVDAWKEKGTPNILCRLYGVTKGVSHCKFPRFGSHNIIAHEKIPKEGTNYHVLDFSWNKPWAMLWARVRRVGDRNFVYVYREWPDADTYGEWVVRSEKPDGAAGPAQHPMGYGISEYKRLILRLEGHSQTGGIEHDSGSEITDRDEPEVVFARYGDPRSGASTTLADEGATTIFHMLEDEDEKTPSMIVEPVAGREGKFHIEEGVNMINELLSYDPDKPFSPMNTPLLFISERCRNVIDCLKMWTGAQKDVGASKDFIDLLRYLAMMDPQDMGKITQYETRPGRTY